MAANAADDQVETSAIPLSVGTLPILDTTGRALHGWMCTEREQRECKYVDSMALAHF
jgi:hypothetical protein